jgi:superfamily II DNA or RNA helicase
MRKRKSMLTSIIGWKMDENLSLAERYNSFQAPAVNAVARDFATKLNGRYLLVIPTGGGKTFTAVKSICELYKQETLRAGTDKVLWIAHRTELVSQAQDTFLKCKETIDTPVEIADLVFSMVGDLQSELRDLDYKLVVIDEAHHSAANSYQPAFERTTIGILGLTATPSRHDGKPLEFEKESFSIGFPDLVNKGIIIRPEIIKISGDRYEITTLSDDDLETLNNDVRNKKILDSIRKNVTQFKKVIIYVGTKNHAKHLFDMLSDSDLSSHYESISYIDGESNSRNQSRDDFIDQEKVFTRSILVNVQVLTEGYDDPAVNTVIMAAPSQSKLYYMQAIGRAIRKDPNDLAKQAFVVELEEELPNIRYRIDNRWLFSDISDALEPQVEDLTYSYDVNEILPNLYSTHKVPHRWEKTFHSSIDERYSMLLFKQYIDGNTYHSFPVLIDSQTRIGVRHAFNFLSERMSKFRNSVDPEQAFNMAGSMGLLERRERRLVFDAMANAATLIADDSGCPEWITNGNPWITFVSLNCVLAELPSQLLQFCGDMINQDDILNAVRTKSYEAGSQILKLPLPLASSVGKIVTNSEASAVDDAVNKLTAIKTAHAGTDHHAYVDDILGRTIFPIEHAYARSLVTIVREENIYLFSLE